jgi:NAD(P)-dependent dehydrogenase (short-subunit alcohol dehydrogenase family)
MKLKGKVALITGASRGTGAATAVLFAQEGADIALAARSRDELESVAALVRDAGTRAEIILTDMSDGAAVEAMVAETVARLGRLDILVNNAGGAGAYVEGGSAGLIDSTTEAWDGLFALNLRGPFIAAREAAKVMRDQGSGSIINIGSIHGQFTRWSYQAYSATKAALSELTAMWAVELGQYGIRVNEIAPGVIVAGLNGGRLMTSEKARTDREAMVPLGRLGTPEDVAQVALFLASDESAYVSGATIATGGGWRGDMTHAPRPA